MLPFLRDEHTRRKQVTDQKVKELVHPGLYRDVGYKSGITRPKCKNNKHPTSIWLWSL